MQYVTGNSLFLLYSGQAFFPALIAAIDEAEVAVMMETYIFAADATGLAVASALQRAARRGVQVQILIDGYGSKKYVPEPVIEAMRRDGVQVGFYRPDVFRRLWSRTRLRRLHRKLTVIDGIVGFVGGINIIDDCHTPHHTPPRVDFAVMVRGPLLPLICSAMSTLWRISRVAAPGQGLRPAAKMPKRASALGNAKAAFVTRDNFRNRRQIERAYLDAITHAQTDVLIANAYFLPGIRFRAALVDAARRGVRVRVLLQARTEYLMVNLATRALYEQLLSGGVEIYEYEKSFLHAKVAVIDSDWATVGSSNIDPLSLLLAREANLIASDAEFAGQLRSEVEALIARGARRISAEQWARRSPFKRTAHWLTYGVVRLLISFFAFGAKDYR